MRIDQLFPKRLPAAHWRNIAAGILLAGVSMCASPPVDADPGSTVRVSVSSAGMQGNGDSFGASISADGRFVAFRSFATNLVPGHRNRVDDVFVHDRQTGTTTGVSVDTAGTFSSPPSLSADGRFVAFDSVASTSCPTTPTG